jgi:hypothetical protein
MTNQGDQGSNDPGKGKVGVSGVRPLAAPQTRSLSLKDALAALGEENNEEQSQSEALPSAESTMSNNENQPSADSSSAGPKTKIFGGSSEELKYYQEPVVGWLVVVGGPGLGAFRPIFVGSNTIGSDSGQRIPIDFGDDYISKEEQAYIRYDADDRQFLFIPNLAKTNVVSIDNVKPTSAVRLMPYDIISMGNTKLVFIPFCGDEFDWTDLPTHAK